MENMKSLLTVPYRQDNFKKFSINFLKNVESIPLQENTNIPSAFKNTIKSYTVFGRYTDAENNKIIVLSVKVKENSSAQKAQRQFISYLLENEFIDYSAALVAYYDDVRKNWKLSFVTIEYSFSESGVELKFKPAKRFSFLVGEDEPTRTYVQQLEPVYTSNERPTLDTLTDAFSVARLSKDFYEDYKKKFFELYDYLVVNKTFAKEANKIGYLTEEEVSKFTTTFCKKTLGQIMFLHFVQKKGWLGVSNTWGDGDKRYLLNSTESYTGDNYFNDFLEPLFYEALNVKRPNDIYLGKKIPFLNGGLFHPIEEYDWNNTNFDIPNGYWFNDDETGLLNILSQYNFTVDEADSEEQEVAIDPEMLGKIFESLLDVEDRSNLGAFYTPREIVQYMCEESLALRISEVLNLDYESILNFIKYGDALKETEFIKTFARDIDEYIKSITVVDPACGSGAFLVGMLNQIVKLRQNLMDYVGEKLDKYDAKILAIQNSLYGVDIEFDAVEIAKLRLWLSLIVDESTLDQSPKPLPNLSFHLRMGNSLVDTYEGIKLWNSRWRGSKVEKKANNLQMNLFNIDTINSIMYRLKNAKVKYFNTFDPKEKEELLKYIELQQMELIKSEMFAKGDFKRLNSIESLLSKKTKPFFIWELEFEEVFEDGGFDIVLGNPPYVSTASQVADENLSIQRKQIVDSKKYHTLYSKWDLYIPFVELGLQLIKQHGNMSMIIPYPITNQIYAKKMRQLLMTEYDMTQIVDLKEAKVFDATVQNCIIFVKNNLTRNETLISTVKQDKIVHDFIQPYSRLIQDEKSLIWNLSKEERRSNKYDEMYTLKDFCYISKGMVLNADEKKAKGEFKKKDLISPVMTKIHIKKYLEGKDIDKFIIKRVRYLEWGTKRSPHQLSRPTFEELYINKKLLFNCLGELKATIDENGGYYCEQAIRVAVLWKDLREVDNKSIRGVIQKYSSYSRSEMEELSSKVSLKYLLGIVNSKKGEELFTAIRGGDYHVVPEHLRQIPIPIPSDTELQKIESLVDKIITCKIEDKDCAVYIDELDEQVRNLYN